MTWLVDPSKRAMGWFYFFNPKNESEVWVWGKPPVLAGDFSLLRPPPTLASTLGHPGAVPWKYCESVHSLGDRLEAAGRGEVDFQLSVLFSLLLWELFSLAG